MALEILTCGACGGRVPLAEGDAVRCPFCRADVTLPPEYRELRDAERRAAEGRTEATALFERWGRPPSRAERVAAVMFHPWVAVFGIAATLLVMMLGGLWILTLFGSTFHANPSDTLPDSVKGVGVYGFAGAFALVGVALGVYGRRRLLAARNLQAALAARPPERPGESAACRSCGAPLHVPVGARGTRCVYCKSDNLLAVPERWILGIKADARRVGNEIEAAVKWLAGEHARLRRALRKHLLIVGGALVGYMAIVLLVMGTPRWQAGWRDYVQRPRTLVRYVPGDKRSADYREVTLGANCGDERVPVAASECQDGRCELVYFAALRAGEPFSIASTDLPPDTRVRVAMHTTFVWLDMGGDHFGERVLDAGLEASQFKAPWSAWYQIRISFPGAAGVRVVCAALGS